MASFLCKLGRLRVRQSCVVLVGLAFACLSAESQLRAQERIYGAAIPFAESYERGARVDKQYADAIPFGVLPYGLGWPGRGPGYGGPWYRGFGWYPGIAPYGALGWYGSGLYSGRGLALGARYAPFVAQPSPNYVWPYEWSYGPSPLGPTPTGLVPAPDPWVLPFAHQQEPRSLGPRRLFW